jgi:nitrate reductase gamma subunit
MRSRLRWQEYASLLSIVCVFVSHVFFLLMNREMSAVWCSGFVAQSYTFVSGAGAVAVAATIIGLWRAVMSIRRGCPELSLKATDGSRSTAPDEAEGTQLVGQRTSSSRMAAALSYDRVRLPVVETTWQTDILEASQMMFILVPNLEPVIGPARGVTRLLLISAASSMNTIMAIVREISGTRAQRVASKRVISMLTVALIISFLVAATTIASTFWSTLTNVWELQIVMASTTAAIGLAIRVWPWLRMPDDRLLSSVLLFMTSTALQAAAVYGSIVPLDERETVAAQQQCYGNTSASRSDMAVMLGSIAAIVDGIILLSFSMPKCVDCSYTGRKSRGKDDM